jgi:MHS family alpha-ketoglutarate permease-like MFS transporter
MDGSAADRRHRLKSIIGGSAGNLVEWYDWYVYSAFTLYFAPVFFPSGDQTAQLLSAAAVFAVGFLMRPIGAWFMGIYADRRGRKAGLTLSVTLMCLGSLLIAVTPGHATIGVLAPAILVFARLLQGFSVGGEYGASATYLSEMAGKSRRGFFSSFQYVTLISGQLLALAVLLVLQRVLTPEQLTDWGWRIPFFIGGVLAIVVFYIRRGLAETQSFKTPRRAARRSPAGWTLFVKYPKEAFMVLALTAGGTLAFYAYTTYLQKFLVNTSGFSKERRRRSPRGAVHLHALPAARRRAFRPHRPQADHDRPSACWACCSPGRSSRRFPGTNDPYVAFGIVLCALLIVTGYTSINAVVKAELFPAHIRALGVALPYALANTIFGGTAEWVALKFKQIGHESGFFWYVTIMIGLSLITYLRMRDTRKYSEILED